MENGRGKGQNDTDDGFPSDRDESSKKRRESLNNAQGITNRFGVHRMSHLNQKR
jgi:hypothetical protein